jgi:DNA-binding SARP family transcriptional activator/tetratricopeptide (TPR) repeat protein
MAPDSRPQVRLLGPVDIRINGGYQPVAGLRRKAVLAALALSAGQTVSVDLLIDIVWSGTGPATAANTLQSHVSFLRGLLGSRDAIVAASPGYRLELGDDPTDLYVAERLLARATELPDPADRVRAVRSALALWRSEPLADLRDIAWFGAQAERIDRMRIEAVTSLVDARLSLGEHVALVSELEALVRERPFDEARHGQLMVALYRSGRQADAFEVYRGLRARLLDELGIDPGRALRDLETAMLRQDPSLEAPQPAVATSEPTAGPTTGPEVIPSQLPPALPHFVGREAELELLDQALEPDGSGQAAKIYAISGPPGVGKTSLAIAWAHRIAPRCTGGQLYINLRGFDPHAEPVDPSDAVHGFLEALGVAPQRIPEARAARVGLYRSVLAGKHVLIVLDNARDADHVRPLLPGSPECIVVITSRNKLTSLVAHEGAAALPVEVLSRPAAHALLTQRLGQKRIANEPEAVDDLISRCAGLPLALSIVAARAATEPAWSLATIAGQMSATSDALDALSGGDHSADIRTVISWSYRALSPAAAHLFRQISVHPGTEFGVHAVASLAALPLSRARRLLAELAGASLIMALSGERYAFHDLIRAYALEQGQEQDSDADRSDVMRRLLDHYLHTSAVAAELLDVYRDAIVTSEPGPGVTPVPLAEHEDALAWFITEYPTLLAAVRQAAASGFDEYTWQLAGTMAEFFERRGLWHDWLSVLAAALRAAERLDDPRALAYSHRGLGRANHWLGHYEVADRHHRAALAHFTALGDPFGQARVWHSLGRLAELQGKLEEALAYTQNGLELFQAAGDRPGVAKALNGVGWYYCLLGDYHQALRYCSEALAMVQEIGDRRVEANTWDSLGYAHHQAGDYRQAIECYEQGLVLFRDIGDRFHEADASDHLGDVFVDAGDPQAAAQAWQRAASILAEFGHPDAARVQAKVAALAG